MIKVMGLIQRKPSLPMDAFRLHWRTIHRDLALRIANAGIIRGYVQNHRLDIPVDGMEPFADGVPELWFEDLASFSRMRDDPSYRGGALHDGPRFMDVDHYESLILEDEFASVGQSRKEVAGMLKAIFPLDCVREPVGPDFRSAVLGAVPSTRLSWHRSLPGSVSPGGWNGVETSWWPDLETFMAAWRARPGRSPIDGILIEEKPVFWPGQPPPPAGREPIQTSGQNDFAVYSSWPSRNLSATPT